MFKRLFTFLFVAFFIAMLSLGTIGCGSDSSDTSDDTETIDTDDTANTADDYVLISTSQTENFDDNGNVLPD